jgi:transcriptional regulator with XRE-family HTH domain
MGTRPRHRPDRLGEKLLRIRIALGLSQSELLKRLEAEEDLAYHRISEYESDKREPPLWILLAYARAAAVHLEDIVDDEIDLPSKLPGNVHYRGLPRKPSPRSGRKHKA